MVKQKICKNCENVFDIECFPKNKSMCKTCFNEKSKIVRKERKIEKIINEKSRTDVKILMVEKNIDELNQKIGELSKMINDFIRPILFGSNNTDVNFAECVLRYYNNILKAQEDFKTMNGDMEKLQRDVNNIISNIKDKMHENDITNDLTNDVTNVNKITENQLQKNIEVHKNSDAETINDVMNETDKNIVNELVSTNNTKLNINVKETKNLINKRGRPRKYP